MFLTRDQIVNADDRKPIELPVPEWGGSIYIQPLSIHQRNEVEALVLEDNPAKKRENLRWLRAKTIAYGMIDSEGKRFFNPANRDDLRLINEKSSDVMERIFEKIQEISGMRKRDEVDAEENFDEPQEGDLPSD